MQDYPKDVYRVRVGDWDMQVGGILPNTPPKPIKRHYFSRLQVPDVEEQEFRVESVHFHEEYNVGIYLNNDIALVRLRGRESSKAVGGRRSRLRGIRFGARVVPACLPPTNAAYGAHLNCTVTGWGSTGVAKPGYTRYLQAASLPLLRTEQCAAPAVYGPDKLGSGMYCAGFLEGGVDTCQGDSGGGMVCQVRQSTNCILFAMGERAHGTCMNVRLFPEPH